MPCGIICHGGTALPATHACMQSHNPRHRLARGCMPSDMLLHMLYLPHKHACSCKIRHTGMHALHSLPHRQACSCMQSHILLHMMYPPHRHKYICIICHTRMHVLAYSAHRWHLPHRHEYICIICHMCMHVVGYCATQAVSATQASMQAYNLPRTNCIIRHTGTHAAA